MKISPAILGRHLEDAAIEQLSTDLSGEGYEVQREARIGPAGNSHRVDLLARRGHDTIVYEVKVPGDRSRADLSRTAQAARDIGAQFRLVVVRPQREVGIHVEGVEDLLVEALRAAGIDVPAPLAGAQVGGTTDVLLDEARIGPGTSEMEISGSASALFDPRGRGDERDAAGLTVPFTFTLWFDPVGRHLTRPARITWDLSELDEDA